MEQTNLGKALLDVELSFNSARRSLNSGTIGTQSETLKHPSTSVRLSVNANSCSGAAFWISEKAIRTVFGPW